MRAISILTALASTLFLAVVAALPTSALSQVQLSSGDGVEAKLRELLSRPESRTTGPVNLLQARPEESAARLLGEAESNRNSQLKSLFLVQAPGRRQESDEQSFPDIFGGRQETRKTESSLEGLLKAAGIRYTAPQEGFYRIEGKDNEGGTSVIVAAERKVGAKKIAYFVSLVAPLPKEFEPPVEMLKRIMKMNCGQIGIGDVSLDNTSLYYDSSFWLRTADAEQITDQLRVAHFVTQVVRRELVPYIGESVPGSREEQGPSGGKEAAASSSLTWRGKEITVLGSGSISTSVRGDQVEIQINDHQVVITQSGVSVDGKARSVPNSSKIAIVVRGDVVSVVVDGQQILP